MGEGTEPGPVTYGDYGFTLDAEDRGKNNPNTLDEYAIEIDVYGEWPGVEAPASVLKFDPDGMRRVAQTLQELHDLVASVPGQLPPSTISYGPSSWTEAGQLQTAGRIVTDAINEYSATLIQNLAAARRDIAASAARNDVAENAADGAVRSSGTGIGGA